jgi:ABC transporter with metal-binding/Fe-S-binding domain ATP-binding protein
VVLFSGGKDSTYALYETLKTGHEVSSLLTMLPRRQDSWMFHHPCVELTPLQAEALGLPLTQAKTEGVKELEINDLKKALKNLRDRLRVEAVVSGAIASQYQRSRIDRVCEELGLKSLTPLWHRDPETLLKEMLKAGFEIVFTAVAAQGFTAEWLGRRLDVEVVEDLKRLNRRYGVNLSLEGGEGETLVLDCPLFHKRIHLTRVEKVWHLDSGYLIVKETILLPKKADNRDNRL